MVAFVVDTTGLADPASQIVLTSPNTFFAAAAREALPLMRFRPAEIQAAKVKQLVQMSFMFKRNP